MMEELLEPREGNLHVQPYKDAKWEEVSVQLNKERLLVLKRDVVYEDTMANNDIVERKEITLQRDAASRLGVVIMGGLDFKSPIKIYRIIEGTPAQVCGELHEQDVILKINNTSMWGLSHDEAVEVVRQSGDSVTLHTAKLRLREIEDQLAVEEHWVTMADIPIQMAAISRYQTGTAILRPNGFEVTSRDGKTKVCLRCTETQELTDWIDQISRFILVHNKQEVERYNNNLSESEQVVQMGWVYEQVPSTIHAHIWQRKFLALKKDRILLYSIMPESIAEWERPEKCYKLLEMTVQVLEAHSIPDQRANCLVLTSGTGQSHIISCETKANITDWSVAIHETTMDAVHNTAQVKYSGRWKDRDVDLVLDINQGILLCSRNSPPDILWGKPFSYLQQSSDDGHSKLKLKCAIKQSRITETQDIELDDLQLAICGMECFVAAKVARLDPDFIKHHTDLVAY